MATAKEAQPEVESKPALKVRLLSKLESLKTWVSENRRQAILIGSGSLISMLATIIGFFVVITHWGPDESVITAEMTLEMLDAENYPDAIKSAKQLYDEKQTSFDDIGLVSYVLGIAGALETDERWEKDKARSYLVAARYLEEARDRGFLPDRQAEGIYQLGRCQFLSGQFADSRLNLLAALKLNPTRTSEIYRMLATASLKEANPRLEQALEFNAKFLEGKQISIAASEHAWIERAQIYFRQGDMPNCGEALTNVPDTSKLRSDAIVLEGRMLMYKAEQLQRDPSLTNDPEKKSEIDQLYNQAIETFRQAQSQDSLKAQATPKAMYLIGLCWQKLGKLTEARTQLDRTRQLYNEFPEGLAAGLAAADVLQQLGEDKEAVAGYRREFARAGSPDKFSNPWLTLDDLRDRMMQAYRQFLVRQKFEAALEILTGFRPIFTKAETIHLQAETNRTWGDTLSAQAEQAKLPLSRQLEKQAARQYRHAGSEYLELARLHLATREYSNDIWNSAENLLRGRDYFNAISTLKEYLKIELRARRPQALVALARATLTVGEIDESIAACQEVMEYFQNDAALFEARYWCSKAYQEKGELGKAEDLLRLNLTGDTLTPASVEWRNSLIELGRLLNGVGKYQEAIGYLNEAIARYPHVPDAIEAQYLVAESYREAARVPQEKLQSAEIESVRVAQTNQLRELLSSALKNYKAVLELLNRQEEESPLTPHEAAMLRNCYFGIGLVLFDLGRYEESIKAYSNASTRYQNEPLVLEAFVQIANCYRHLGRVVEARGALEQAKVVWKRLPTEVDYTQTTNYSRDEWQKLFDLLSSW